MKIDKQTSCRVTHKGTVYIRGVVVGTLRKSYTGTRRHDVRWTFKSNSQHKTLGEMTSPTKRDVVDWLMKKTHELGYHKPVVR